MDKKNKNTQSKVVKGVKRPPLLNPAAVRKRQQQKRKHFPAEVYVKGILEQNRTLLAQAITIIESTRKEDYFLAQKIIELCLPHSEKSHRIGITGTPGVGKSTFIESIGWSIIQEGKKVAALAIDPSSQVSKGSILGDKTRMEKLSSHMNAFIRPSAAGTSLGGVARKTRETIILCEAAGFDTIIIETVGVGQSEIAVHSMVDLFLLLIAPGGGDELQGIKRGIVEMADLVVVNKTDGERTTLARKTRQDYRNALHLFPAKQSNWTPQVISCSALHQTKISDVLSLIKQYFNFIKSNHFFKNNRQIQAKYWLEESIDYHLKRLFYQHPEVRQQLHHTEQAVLTGQLSPFQGAQHLLDLFSNEKE